MSRAAPDDSPGAGAPPLFGGPLPAVALVLAMITEAIGYGMVAPTLPFMARLTGADEGRVGLLVGIYAGVGLVAAPILLTMANRRGRRAIILLGLLCLTLASIGFTLAPGYRSLVAARLLQGFGAAGVWVGCLTLAADLSQDKSMGRSLAWLTGAWSLGFIIGPALGGIGSLRLPFILYAAIAAIALVVGWIGLPHGGVGGPDATFAGIIRVFRRPGVLASGIATFGLAFFYGAIEAFVPLLIAGGSASAAAGGLGRGQIGLLFSVAGIPSVFLPRLAGKIADRRGDTPLIAAGFLLAASWSASFLLLYGRVPSLPLFLLLGCVEVMVYVPAVALLHRGVAGEERVFASGTHAYAFSIGFFLGPLVAGALFPYGGFRTMFATLAAVTLCAAVGVVVVARKASPALADRPSAY
ncbi:MAG TPA: MFS transporter [Candidatus Polarisedimenticolia bacterium]|nr:MFS transporter [Candidatus Polarisedimenticolia bacterium]